MGQDKWTTADIPDFTGKTIIVTGGNSGLGYESVKALAMKGAHVILTSRTQKKGAEAKQKLEKEINKGTIEILTLDLADLSSVKEFAIAINRKFKTIDVLLNNAGIMMTPYQLTKDGFESQFGTNHLGHFALTALMKERLLNTPGSRIVNVSSNAHKYGKMDWENLMFESGKGYAPLKAYGRSKLANLLFTYELDRRLQAAGSSSKALAAHPGTSKTNLARYVENKFVFKLFSPFLALMAQPASQGALPQLRAATDPKTQGSEYYGPDGLNQIKGYPVKVDSSKASYNAEDAQKLWDISEQLTGIRFQI